MLVMSEMAAAIDHPDKDVVLQMAGGFPLAGEIAPSGAFAQKRAEDVAYGESLPWLADQALAIEEDLRAAWAERPLQPEILDKIRKATFYSEDEVVDDVGRDWIPARRFGIRQGPEVRPIYDLTRNSVNSATTVVDHVVPAGVDSVLAVARRWIEEVKAGTRADDLAYTELGSRTFDLQSAYKQCGVRSDHARLSHLAFEAPSSPDEPYLYLSAALPFGASASVVQFNRAAKFLQQILAKLFRFPVTNYFDDAMWPLFAHILTEVGALLGWLWKQATFEASFVFPANGRPARSWPRGGWVSCSCEHTEEN